MSDRPIVSAEEVASVLSDENGPDGSASSIVDESQSDDVRFTLRRPVMIAADTVGCAKRKIGEIASSLQRAMSKSLQTEIEIDVHGFQQQQVRAGIDRLAGPVWVLGFECEPVGMIALGLDPSTALAIVELTLGGSGGGAADNRGPTPLEIRVMSNLARSLVPWLDGSNELHVVGHAFSVGELERRLAAPQEMVGAGLLRLRIGGTERNGLLLVSPALLRPTEVESQLTGDTGPIARALQRVPLEARPVLRCGRVSLDELTRLEPGNLILLEAPSTSELDLLVNGVALFRGRVEREPERSVFSVLERRGASDPPEDAETSLVAESTDEVAQETTIPAPLPEQENNP